MDNKVDLHVLMWKDMLLSEKGKLQNRMYKMICFLNIYAYYILGIFYTIH